MPAASAPCPPPTASAPNARWSATAAAPCSPGAGPQVVQALRAALDGGQSADTGSVPGAEIFAAAADLKAAEAPVAFLVHPAVLAAAGAGELQAFAARLGATGEGGLVGA